MWWEGSKYGSPARSLQLGWYFESIKFSFCQVRICQLWKLVGLKPNLCTCFKLFLKFEKPGPPIGSLKGGAKLLLEVAQLCTNLNMFNELGLCPFSQELPFLPSLLWTVGQRELTHCERGRCRGKEPQLWQATNARELNWQHLSLGTILISPPESQFNFDILGFRNHISKRNPCDLTVALLLLSQ